MTIDVGALLDEGAELVADLYLDTLKITRDERGTDDAAIDDNTGLQTQAAAATVYSGPGKMRPLNRGEGQSTEGGKSNYLDIYDCAVPLTAAIIKTGDYVECTASRRDTSLVGKKAIVTTAQGNTLAIQRKFEAEEAANVRRLRP